MKKIKVCVVLTVIAMLSLFCSLNTFVQQAEMPSLLKDIDVSNGRIIQFEKDITYYTVELYEGEKKADIIALPKDDNCRVEIEGDDAEVVPGKKNTVTISAYDTSGNFATYILDVYAYGKELNGLEFIRCLNGTMAPQYRETANQYYVILPEDQDHVELDIRTKNETDSVVITGNSDLQQGKRTTVYVNIIDKDGNESQYNVYAYRRAPMQSGVSQSFLLSNIEINGGKIPILFNQNQGYYEIEVPNNISTIDIQAVAMERTNIVQVYGADVLGDSDSIVNIVVSNPDDNSNEQSVYTIKFYHNQFTRTQKYTDFQLLVSIISVAFITVLLMIGWYFWAFKGKKTRTYEEGFIPDKISIPREEKDHTLTRG